MGFLAELKRRKVYRVAIAYISAAVAITLAATELYEVLLLPGWPPRLVLIVLVAGLPVALVLAWATRSDRPGSNARRRWTTPTSAIARSFRILPRPT